MGEVEEPIACVQCSVCEWWCFYWEARPTLPLVCDYCKMGLPPWDPPRPTPSYGTPRARLETIPFGVADPETRIVEKHPSKKRRRKR